MANLLPDLFTMHIVYRFKWVLQTTTATSTNILVKWKNPTNKHAETNWHFKHTAKIQGNFNCKLLDRCGLMF